MDTTEIYFGSFCSESGNQKTQSRFQDVNSFKFCVQHTAVTMGANSSKDHENETPSRSLSKPTIGKLPYCPLPLKFKESSDPNWAGEFSVFSKEMFQEFSVHLPAQDILSFSSTCQTLHSYLSEDIFWRHVIELRKVHLVFQILIDRLQS